MDVEEWKRDAESLLLSAEAEDVRIALLERLAEQYAAPHGILRLAPGQQIDFRNQPLADLRVSTEDAQILASFEYLKQLKEQVSNEQFSWTRQYFSQRLKIWYRGSRSRAAYVDSLIRRTAVRRHLDSRVDYSRRPLQSLAFGGRVRPYRSRSMSDHSAPTPLLVNKEGLVLGPIRRVSDRSRTKRDSSEPMPGGLKESPSILRDSEPLDERAF